jgi:hypothetical protein
MPFLLHHIGDIVLRRAEEKMSRIATRRIIAMMTDQRIARIHTEVKIVGDAMGMLCVPALNSCVGSPVSPLIDAGLPFPAGIRIPFDGDLGPKSLLKGISVASVVGLHN